VTVIVTLTNGVREEFEAVEELESGWIRCTRPRNTPEPDLPGETTTKYYPLAKVDTVERDTN
jgi:hypothetical protein